MDAWWGCICCGACWYCRGYPLKAGGGGISAPSVPVCEPISLVVEFMLLSIFILMFV